MKVKTNFKDILKGNDGKYSIRAVIAFHIAIVFGLVGIADACIKGVNVDEGFYWASVVLITSMVATRALEHIAAIRSGQASIAQNKNNFDQQVNNLEQSQNNKSNEEP